MQKTVNTLTENEEGALIHIGTIGMGIPRIYSEVIAKIISYHLATEALFAQYIKKHGLHVESDVFGKRLTVVKAHSKRNKDWAMKCAWLLNDVRNKCAHIDTDDYKNVAQRLQLPLEKLIRTVQSKNKRHPSHLMSDFEWAGILIYQRLHEILEIDYPPLVLGAESDELTTFVISHFQPLRSKA